MRVLTKLIMSADNFAHWLDCYVRVPRFLAQPLCSLLDYRLGMTWAEIRRARVGTLPGYAGQFDPWPED